MGSARETIEFIDTYGPFKSSKRPTTKRRLRDLNLDEFMHNVQQYAFIADRKTLQYDLRILEQDAEGKSPIVSCMLAGQFICLSVEDVYEKKILNDRIGTQSYLYRAGVRCTVTAEKSYYSARGAAQCVESVLERLIAVLGCPTTIEEEA